MHGTPESGVPTECHYYIFPIRSPAGTTLYYP